MTNLVTVLLIDVICSMTKHHRLVTKWSSVYVTTKYLLTTSQVTLSNVVVVDLADILKLLKQKAVNIETVAAMSLCVAVKQRWVIGSTANRCGICWAIWKQQLSLLGLSCFEVIACSLLTCILL